MCDQNRNFKNIAGKNKQNNTQIVQNTSISHEFVAINYKPYIYKHFKEHYYLYTTLNMRGGGNIKVMGPLKIQK